VWKIATPSKAAGVAAEAAHKLAQALAHAFEPWLQHGGLAGDDGSAATDDAWSMAAMGRAMA
jgi:hypothetical protein